VKVIATSRGLIADVRAWDPDLVIIYYVDNGFDLGRVCHDLRESTDRGFIVCAGRQMHLDDNSIIEALDAGADDVVTPDVSDQVMMARVRVALRSRAVRDREARITIGDIAIDIAAHRLLIASEAVNCPPRQFALLAALASQPNVMVRGDALLASVWGVLPTSVHPRRLRSAVSVLRRLLGTGPERPTIETVSNFGYRLVGPPQAPAPHDSRSAEEFG